jgi:hypothetical protein
MTRTEITTMGEDTDHTKRRYLVDVGPYLRYDIVAVDAYDAERRARNLYISTYGERPTVEPVARIAPRGK